MGAPGPGLTGRPPRAVVRAAVRDSLADLAPGDRVLVALSGGPDSLALLAATIRVTADAGLLCQAVVIDHGLQPGSDQIAANAVEQARILGCPDARVIRVEVGQGPGNGGPEAAARAARYAALDAAALGNGATGGEADPAAAAILLGHTRDDQAETVLLGLARGSGLRSIAGMTAVSGRSRRPLLDVPREVVRAAAEAEALGDPRLTAWSDPHNASERFARVRVRTAALPELERALGPGVAEALARTATLARDDVDALDLWAQHVWTALLAEGAIELPQDVIGPPHEGLGRHDGPVGQESPTPQPRLLAALSVASLTRPAPAAHDLTGGGVAQDPTPPPPSGLPDAIRSRIVRRLLLASGCPPGALTADHVRAVLGLVDGPARSSAEIALPGARRARREGSYVRVRA